MTARYDYRDWDGTQEWGDLDPDDLLVFMACDAGERAPGGAPPAAAGREIRIDDPLDHTTGWAYLVVATDPPLTTVDGLGVQKGRTAARIVFEGGPPRHEILKPRLIMRASTGPAPVR